MYTNCVCIVKCHLHMCVLAFQPVVLQCACCTCVIITDTLVVHVLWCVKSGRHCFSCRSLLLGTSAPNDNVTVGEEGGANLPKPVIDLN